MLYIMARKGADGRYRLFYRGTRNEVFPGMAWATAADARWHYKVEVARGINREYELAEALAALRAAYAAQGLDADAEVDGIDTMTADQLRDEVTYLSDYQG